jgi:very-short-patch-repair endonuclease
MQHFNATKEEDIKEYISSNSNCVYVSGYINARSKITLKCLCGSEFQTNFMSFKAGKKHCHSCKPKPFNKFSDSDIARVIASESDCEYVSGWIDGKSNFKIKCKCGNEFVTMLSNFRNGKKRCCKCVKSQSSGEKRIEDWLTANDVDYISEKRFSDCRSKRALPFDFYLPSQNICIEYDGEQHFRNHLSFGKGDSLDLVQQRDAIKTKYCSLKNIKLIRIPYIKAKNIEVILNEQVNTEIINQISQG